MSVKKQVGIVVGVFLLMWVGLPLLYGVLITLVRGGTAPAEDDPVFLLSIILAFGWLFLGIIYLTIGAAIRHNNRR